MNEDHMAHVRKIVRDEIYEILDVEVWDVIFELVNAQEAGITAFRQRLKKRKIEPWNANKIKWNKAEGSKGPYERSEDLNNLEFKAMLKELASHNGKLRREGYFYWLFKNGARADIS